MSNKLLLEFYSAEEASQPTASVLASFGGDTPPIAATTLADYFNDLSKLREPRYSEAGLLASRFIAWEGQKPASRFCYDFTAVALVPFNTIRGCQTVRVYAQEPRPRVHFVNDEWTTHDELEEAALILSQASITSLQQIS